MTKYPKLLERKKILRYYFHTFEKLGNLSMVKECPKLVEWGQRCMHKESVSKSVSDPIAVYEAALEIIRNLGF
ncbi:hypothetical protein CCACVL1_16600 [Corchorus capsularis]|uniref:Uncharacterized protein n=1 Tax=Corchorus capsularis TaxID=210143 RepID=A0A1R3HW21_COCAP|nr:hypothetical protein CCACVL1_16600 [Corchorus capsularis]